MMSIDHDIDYTGNWEIRTICYVDMVRRAVGVDPEIRVSPRSGGLHLMFPGVPPSSPVSDDIRYWADCPGHARYTELRRGCDVLFERRARGQVSRPTRDVFEALDLLRQQKPKPINRWMGVR